MIKCAIVEDEEEFIQILKQYMDSFQKQNNCFIELSIFRNGQEILDSNQKFDLIFMDIDMPIMDGMTAAKKMRELDSQFVLVFITNLANLAIKGYEVNAIDFVIKPLNYFEFSVKLKKVIDIYLKKKSHYVRFMSNDRVMYRVLCSSITYVEIKGHNITVHANTNCIFVYGTLKSFMEKLNDDKFMLINKYYLVNTIHIVSFDSNSSMVILDDGTELQCSRSNKKKIIEFLK